MKIRVRTIILFLLIIGIAASLTFSLNWICGDERKFDDNVYKGRRGLGAVCDKGYFYRSNDIWNFFDFGQEQSVVLCTRPNCSHNDSRCESKLQSPGEVGDFFAELMVTNGKRMYLIYQDFGKLVLVEASMDGTKKRVISSCEGILPIKLLLHQGNIFMLYSHMEVNEGGLSGGSGGNAVGKFDLTNGKFELISNPEKNINFMAGISGIYKQGLYCFEGTYHYDEAENFIGQKGGIIRYDIVTGEKRIVYEGTDAYMIFQEDGIGYGSDESGKKIIRYDLESETYKVFKEIEEMDGNNLLTKLENTVFYLTKMEKDLWQYDFDQNKLAKTVIGNEEIVSAIPWWECGEYCIAEVITVSNEWKRLYLKKDEFLNGNIENAVEIQ